MIPLPFTCQREAYEAGAIDDYGNQTPDWAAPVDVSCFWWTGATTEPVSAPTGGDLAAVDLSLVLDSAELVDHRDRFIVAGRTFEVIGLPKEWDHGPFSYQPGRQILELKWVG